LFSGTVAENICYACRGSKPLEQIERLSQQIGNGEWLNTLPQGLQTEVGERGARLSMGQRQLVSLMRVLVQKPAIFILDEATASIDPFTEWQIQQALDLILQQSTSILIAHRLSTVRSADRIIVMENGRIIEEGDHNGLLAGGGLWRQVRLKLFERRGTIGLEFRDMAGWPPVFDAWPGSEKDQYGPFWRLEAGMAKTGLGQLATAHDSALIDAVAEVLPELAQRAATAAGLPAPDNAAWRARALTLSTAVAGGGG
jgi:energy-coupling factor transporter ATP-binding protein EcfA2